VTTASAGASPAGCDVAIEFSRPDSVLANIRACLEARVPVVVGTTGWYDHLNDVKALVQEHRGALLWASNFSIGVNLFFKLNRQLTRLMDPHADYGARIDEVHHMHKLDAPSGTAITLARDLDLRSSRISGWRSGEDHQAYATQGAVPVGSERTGEVPGKHSITWRGPDDRITITHEAFGRRGFATGAVVAAEWLKGRTGIFTMEDVLATAP
jgi:4-hydroxy-tetrahydrodipicolinate reductase